MSGRGIVLPSAVFTLAFIFMLAPHNARSAPAEDCLPKPTGPTPQGQHWYYRIDHTNQGRQCWHLAPERGADQQDSDQDETQTAAEPAPPARKPAASQSAPEPAAPRAAKSTGPARVPTTAAAPAAALSVAPVPWVNTPSLPKILAFVPPAPSTVQSPIQSTNSTDPSPASNAATAADRPTVSQREASAPSEASAPRDESAANAREQVRRTRDARRQVVKEASFPSPAPVFRSIGEGDHVFALLMIIFIVLAVTGPALHLVERRRRRAAAFQPPRWAGVVPLNAPASPPHGVVPPRPRSARRRPTGSPMRAPAEPVAPRAAPVSDLRARARSEALVPDQPESFSELFDQSRLEPRRPAHAESFSESLVHAQSEPLAPAQPANTDRLADALQQIVERIQADYRPTRNATRIRPSERASG